jgi:hypothetical protein
MTDDCKKLIEQAKEIIFTEFQIYPNAQTWICSLKEFQKYFIEVDLQYKYDPPTQQQILKQIVPQIEGKYWKKKNEIWLVQGRGEKLETIIHEFIHSIQLCRPNREHIVEFLTFKILQLRGKDIEYTDKRRLEWEKICADVGFETLKKRLLFKGDCEDF